MMMPYKIYNKKRKIIHALILTDCEYTTCGHHIINRKNWELDISQFVESEECCKKCVKSLKKEGIL